MLFFAEGGILMTGSDTKVRDTELAALVAARLKGQRNDNGGNHIQVSTSPTSTGGWACRWSPASSRKPVAVNDIRRFVQGMHYPNPLH